MCSFVFTQLEAQYTYLGDTICGLNLCDVSSSLASLIVPSTFCGFFSSLSSTSQITCTFVNFAPCYFRWIHYFFNDVIVFSEFKCIWHQPQKELKGQSDNLPTSLSTRSPVPPRSCHSCHFLVVLPEVCVYKQVNTNTQFYMNGRILSHTFFIKYLGEFALLLHKDLPHSS